MSDNKPLSNQKIIDELVGIASDGYSTGEMFLALAHILSDGAHNLEAITGHVGLEDLINNGKVHLLCLLYRAHYDVAAKAQELHESLALQWSESKEGE